MPESEPEPAHDHESPLVCFCRRVREATILRAIDAGHVELEDLIDATGASTGCGTCRFELMELLATRVGTDPVPESDTGPDSDSGPESGRADRRLVLALAFAALTITTCTIAWQIDLRSPTGTDDPAAIDAGSTPGPGRAPDASIGGRETRAPTYDGSPWLQVVDVFGGPLNDATLELLGGEGPPTPIELDHLARPRPGSELDREPGGERFLWVRHPEFSPRMVPLWSLRTGATLRITMSSRPGVRIRLVDDRSGRGVPHASVRWQPHDLDSRLSVGDVTSLTWTSVSDSEGSVVLRGLPEIPGRIRIESAGHRTLETRLDPSETTPGAQPTFRLEPGRSVRATLIDWNGDPVPNTQVIATPREGGPSARTLSNAEGGLRLSGLPSGGFHAVAVLDGAHVPVQQTRDERRRLTVLTIRRPRRIEGSVVDPGGLRLGRARVRVLAQGQEIRRRTRGDGRFELEFWPAGPARLFASATGHVRRSVVIHSDSPESIEMRLQRAPLIRGRVVDPTGDPIGAAVVSLVADGRSPTDPITAETSPNGQFAIECRTDTGSVRLRVEADGHAVLLSDRIDPTDPVAIELGDLRVPTAARLALHNDESVRFGLPRVRRVLDDGSLGPELVLEPSSEARFDIGPVVPGSYVLVLLPLPLDPRPPITRRVRLSPGRVTELRCGSGSSIEDLRWESSVRDVDPTDDRLRARTGSAITEPESNRPRSNEPRTSEDAK